MNKSYQPWIPAFAGMTETTSRHSREGGNPPAGSVASRDERAGISGQFDRLSPCPNTHAARRSAGFTLLETMVALVIFAAAAMALYGLLNTNLIALARAHDVSRQAPVVRQVIEHLSSINPREESAGRIEQDGVQVSWTATLVEPVRQSQSIIGGLGLYEVGLYELEFTMRAGERSLGVWRMRTLGYEKVREPDF